jgi:hypothetical protein
MQELRLCWAFSLRNYDPSQTSLPHSVPPVIALYTLLWHLDDKITDPVFGTCPKHFGTAVIVRTSAPGLRCHIALVPRPSGASSAATAALGVAIGDAGTDVALESADVLLMGDDLGRLPGALHLARRARQIIHQKLAFAFAVMATLMILAIAGDIPLPLGVVGHEGSTLLVVANGLRLLARWH